MGLLFQMIFYLIPGLDIAIPLHSSPAPLPVAGTAAKASAVHFPIAQPQFS